MSTSGTDGPVGKFNQGEKPRLGIRNCYQDEDITSTSWAMCTDSGSTNLVATTKGAIAETKSDDMIALLNADLSTPIWTRGDDKNNRYPSLNITPPIAYADWEAADAAVSAPPYGHAVSAITPEAPGNPYFIKNPEDLAWFANQVNNVEGQTGLCGKLIMDLNLYGSAYNGEGACDSASDPPLDRAFPQVLIGKSQDTRKGYTGTSNGNEYTVSVIKTKETTSQMVDLSGILGSNANIEDLGTGKGPIRLKGFYTGGIADYIEGTDVALTGCWSGGTLTGIGDDAIGGIFGNSGAGSNDLVINGCYSIGTANSSTASRLGGIVGTLASVINGTMTVQNYYNQGTVNRTYPNAVTGGVIGVLTAADTMKQCYQAGEMAAANVNAIVGTKNGNVEHYFYDASYTPTDTTAAGVHRINFATRGAAFGLSGESLDQMGDISWTYENGEYSTYGALSGAESWGDIGRATEQGFITFTKSNTVPFKPGNVLDLAWSAWKINHGCALSNIVLMMDIDLFGAKYTDYIEEKTIKNTGKALKWKPIGSSTYSFKYIFDGGGHHITSLNVPGTMYVELFGIFNGATVKDITIRSESVAGRDRMGVLVGAIDGAAAVENRHNAAAANSMPASGTVVRNPGGLPGATIESSSAITLTVKNCSSNGNVDIYREDGGALGNINYPNVSVKATVGNCWNRGNTIQRGSQAEYTATGFGGILGSSGSGNTMAKIMNYYSVGNISMVRMEYEDRRKVIFGKGSTVSLSDCCY